LQWLGSLMSNALCTIIIAMFFIDFALIRITCGYLIALSLSNNDAMEICIISIIFNRPG
ncbi:hypothetical protein T01_14301, partial [Trichinella spiralis]